MPTPQPTVSLAMLFAFQTDDGVALAPGPSDGFWRLKARLSRADGSGEPIRPAFLLSARVLTMTKPQAMAQAALDLCKLMMLMGNDKMEAAIARAKLMHRWLARYARRFPLYPP